jgi:branched-chain amino acid transport system ATP-binding protein
MSDAARLEVNGVGVLLGSQTVLRGVSLAVPAGEIVCVLGSNGAGKTTLMRTISGIYRNATGQIRFGGRDILNLPTQEIVALGISQAPEGRHVFPTMTVEENLRVGASPRPAAEYRPALGRVLDLFPILRERLRQRAGSLSGGEQQMLCIGRALMARPRLLLLDEPSLGLAPLIVRQLFDLISRIGADGTSILLVEQNARAALRVARYGYVMESGRVVLEGPAKDLASEELVASAYLGGSARAAAHV